MQIIDADTPQEVIWTYDVEWERSPVSQAHDCKTGIFDKSAHCESYVDNTVRACMCVCKWLYLRVCILNILMENTHINSFPSICTTVGV